MIEKPYQGLVLLEIAFLLPNASWPYDDLKIESHHEAASPDNSTVRN